MKLSCLFTFLIVNIGALLPTTSPTQLLLYFLGKDFFTWNGHSQKPKHCQTYNDENKILLKLRIMVSFLYLNNIKKTIFVLKKIITTIFFLVSKMKQQKKATKQNYSYLKKYQITIINNKYITAPPTPVI